MKNIIIKILKKQEEIIIELIIDNKEENIELNNRIIIKSFVVDENYNFNVNDYVLYDLINILKLLKKPNDIRVNLRKYRNEIN